MATTTSTRALNGWHPGESEVQKIINLPSRVDITAVVNYLPDQHRLFHTTRLHFLPVTTLDEHGRPWVSMLTDKDGNPGFIISPSSTTLAVNARVWKDDPISHNLIDIPKKDDLLISAIGLEVSTRRRNKFSGHVSNVTLKDGDMTLKLNVNQALGLCPKYINLRKIEPYTGKDGSRTICEQRNLESQQRLPPNVIDFIHNSDTAYLGTSYVARPEDALTYPSHVSTNHRGGRPGFVRVIPSDGRTLVIPNYAGNRLMNSLGNIQVTPLAGIVFPCFKTGAILYITGNAQNHFGPPARKIMPESTVITTITATGYIFIDNALPLRESLDSSASRSPYTPPIRYLAEETPPKNRFEDIILSLQSARIHNDTLATFTLRSSKPLDIAPSRNVVLDLSQFLRKKSHELIDWTEGKSTENDDCVRTWTVSIPPTNSDPHIFSITVRQIKGGLITPLMYQIIHNVASSNGQNSNLNQEISISHLNITAGLRGIGGDLPIPEPIANCDGGRRLIWIAGGIGVTPFLGLTRYISEWIYQKAGLWDIVLVISTREPEVILSLISNSMEALPSSPTDFKMHIHLFTPSPELLLIPESWPQCVGLDFQRGRIPSNGEFYSSVEAKDREVHICGPLPFVLNSMEGMKNAGVDLETVKRERFTY